MRPLRFPSPRLFAVYFWVLAGLALLGLGVPLATARAELSSFDLLASGMLIVFPTMSGWGLWRHGWEGWTWSLLTSLAPILEIADGHTLYRLVLGFYCKLPLVGSPPNAGFGFGVGFADPSQQGDLGEWVSVDLVSLGVVVLLFRGAWRHYQATKR